MFPPAIILFIIVFAAVNIANWAFWCGVGTLADKPDEVETALGALPQHLADGGGS